MSRKSELLSAEVVAIAKKELKKLGSYGYVIPILYLSPITSRGMISGAHLLV